ncbi:MAG TPA: hypothetical protein VFZ61_30670 [Polyangiales bacterium]
MNRSKTVTLVSLRPGSDVWESRLVSLTTAIVVPETDEADDDDEYLEAFGEEVTEPQLGAPNFAP